jgi:hypothetical protein
LPGETLKGEVPATVSPLSRSDTGVSPLRRHLTLALIAVVCALSYIDRQVFSIFMSESRPTWR